MPPLALYRILTFYPVILDAVMARRARQGTSERLCADRSALSLCKFEKSLIKFEKKIEHLKLRNVR